MIRVQNSIFELKSTGENSPSSGALPVSIRFRNFIFTILSIIFFTASAIAHDFEVDGIYYNITDSNEVEVTFEGSSYSSYSSKAYSGIVTIPEEVAYNDVIYPVTSIGDKAFYYCTGLTSVTIPNSVISIGDSAFWYCTGLTSITIPNSVNLIDNKAFQNCTGLKELIIEDGEEILVLGHNDLNKGLFYDCPLKKLYLGRNLSYDTSSIYAFNGISTLSSVEIGNTVTSINDYEFNGCKGLTSIVIGNSVTSIGRSAFYGCSKLTSITLPYSTISIGDYAFYGCEELTTIDIPNSVVSIGECAFHNCLKLTSITIPNSVPSIGEFTFYNCSKLTSITIGNSVTTIGNYAFGGCTKLKELTFVDGEETLALGYNGTDNGLFSDCPLEKLYLGRTLSYKSESRYGYSPFYHKSKLSSVEIGNTVTSIGDNAFYSCSQLTSVIIGNSVTSIGDKAFFCCSKLASVIIGNSVTSIGDWAFSHCSDLASVEIPNSVTTIGSSVFLECSGLTSINIPNLVTSIGESAFSGCSALTSIDIPNSVTLIGSAAFRSCSRITSIAIPNSVTSIGNYAFSDCTGITELTFEDGEESLSLGYNEYSLGKGLFYDCPLEKLYLGRNLSYNSSSSYGYSPFYEKTTLSSLEIGNAVTSISDYAFYDCSGLTSIVIPNSVISIGDGAFYNCSGLTSIDIPNSVLTIGNYAFSGCTGLTAIVIPNSVTSIEDNAFYSCTGLTSVTIPNSVTTIGNNIFRECDGLSIAYIGDSVTSIGDNAFYNCSGLATVSIGNSVSSIGENAFFGCSELTSLVIPNSVATIGNYAFSGCTALKELAFEEGEKTLVLGYNGSNKSLFYDCPLVKLYLGRNLSYNTSSVYSPFYAQSTLYSVEIGNTVSSINAYTFYCCSGLTSVTISSSVTSIGNYAFNGCKSLKELTFEDGEETLVLGNDSNGSLFYDCPLEKLYLGRNLSYNSGYRYGYSPFYEKTTLSSLEIGNTVTSISDYEFYGCSGLTSIVFPNSVTEIGNSALENCDNLTDLKFQSYSIAGIDISGIDETMPVFLIPKSDGSYSGISDSNLFSYFADILAINDDDIYAIVKSSDAISFSNTKYCDGEFKLVDYSSSCIVSPCTQSLKVVHQGKEITNKIMSLDGFAFMPSSKFFDNIFYVYGAEDGGSFSLTATLTEAGTLFNEVGLQNLEKIEVLKIIGDINGTDVMIINRMSALKYLDLSDANIVEGGVTYRDNLKTSDAVVGSQFFDDILLEVLYLPNSAAVIESKALYGASSLKVLYIGANIVTIGDYAFYGCSGLNTITIPNSVATIDNSAFSGCTGLKELTIEDGEETLSLGYNNSKNGLFSDCPLEKLYVGRNLLYNTLLYYTSISYGYSPFYGKTTISSVEIGNTVTLISDYEFAGCSNLTVVEIPNYVTSIGKYAFSNCYGLSDLMISTSVNKIDDFAFEKCSGLTSLDLPNSVRTIGSSAFLYCTGLTSVNFPSSVRTIGSRAFENCTGLTSVNILGSVTSLGSYAFNNCSALEGVYISDMDAWCKITFGSSSSNPLCYAHNLYLNDELVEQVDFPDGIEKINANVFYNYSSLKGATIPATVTEIGNEAFYGTGLTEVVLPSAITSIGDSAFANCNSIEKVVSLNPTPPLIQSSTFDSEVEESATLHVQKGSLVYYWLDTVWKEFTNIADDVLCLEAIPNAKYGDREIDLTQYAPNGVALTYETSNDDVVQIDGTKMRIVGAGTATVGALLAEEGTPMEIIGQMRQFTVDQADLTVTVEEIEINRGDPLPKFTYIVDGLEYDDTIDDIEMLPEPICDVDEDSPAGEYEVTFTDGYDPNYRIASIPAKVIVVDATTGIEEVFAGEDDIRVYNTNGVCVYAGAATDANLEKGIYIVKQGNKTTKIYVK